MPGNDNVCLMCLRMYIDENKKNLVDIGMLEHYQNVFTKVSKYLSSDIFEGCFRWNFVAEKMSPVCSWCYSYVEKIFKFNEMLEKLQNAIKEVVNSYTSEVLVHHSRLRDLCADENDSALKDGNSLVKETTEIEYDTDVEIDIKEEYAIEDDETELLPVFGVSIDSDRDDNDLENGGQDDASALEITTSEKVKNASNDKVTQDSALKAFDVSIRYPGLVLKQLRIVVERLQLSSEAITEIIPITVENNSRPRRKAALVASESVKNIINGIDNNTKSTRGLKQNERDSDWDSDSEIENCSEVDSDKWKYSEKNNKRQPTFFLLRGRFLRIIKRYKCQKKSCKLRFKFLKELKAHSSESGHTNDKRYKCIKKSCPKAYFVKNDLKSHIKYCHPNHSIKCSSCPKTFPRRQMLRAHQQNSHAEKLFKCKKCDKSFFRKLNLKQHETLHCGKYFECKKCSKNFIWSISLKIHLDSKHKKENDYKCNICKKVTSSRLQLTRHRLNHFRSKINKIYPCIACKKIHFVEKMWDNCIIKHYREKRQNGFFCAICGLLFKYTKNLDNHAAEANHPNKKLFRCQVCKRDFYKREDLRKHGSDHRRNVGRNTYKCHICPLGFKDKLHFTWHIEWHKNPDQFKCNVCGKHYKSDEDLQQHKIIECEVNRYSCQKCHKNFRQLKELKKHSKSCRKTQKGSQSRDFACKVCEKVFKSKWELELHTEFHQTKDGKLPCKFCGKLLAKKALAYHLETHVTEKRFKCDECELSFTTKLKLERHIISAHCDEKPHKCTTCEKTFKLRVSLRRHMERHISVLCDICGKKYTSKDSLLVHKKIHTGKLHPCTYDLCDKKFFHPSTLLNHIKIVHTKEKQFSCQVCHKTFPSNTNLTFHMRTHTGEKPFSCTQCDKSFSRKNRLKVHVQSAHTEKTEKCNFCGKLFSSKEYLRVHVRCIHAEKKFQCEFCPYLCGRKDYLTTHIKENHTNSKERPFVCEKCGKGFKRKHVLDTHLKWHEKKENDLPDKQESESDETES